MLCKGSLHFSEVSGEDRFDETVVGASCEDRLQLYAAEYFTRVHQDSNLPAYAGYRSCCMR